MDNIFKHKYIKYKMKYLDKITNKQKGGKGRNYYIK